MTPYKKFYHHVIRWLHDNTLSMYTFVYLKIFMYSFIIPEFCYSKKTKKCSQLLRQIIVQVQIHLTKHKSLSFWGSLPVKQAMLIMKWGKNFLVTLLEKTSKLLPEFAGSPVLLDRVSRCYNWCNGDIH